MTQWIKCSERLPDESCEVVALTDEFGVICAQFNLWQEDYKNPQVICYKASKYTAFSAWQPMPPPPEDEA